MSLKRDHIGSAHAQTISAGALRLVETPPYYHEEVKLWTGAEEESTHSLHHTIHYPNPFRAELPAFLIRRYSKRGGVVLDPFCGGGTTGVEANLQGRVALLSDVNPLAIAIAKPKLDPADLAEVTLGLQMLGLKRPVEMGPYGDVFKHFFEAETFREIVNLRSILASREDRASNFIRLIALSLLHGSSAGCFSVYTSSQVSLTPQEQSDLNRERRQVPDYRPVMPRILRKTASALRDGIPSVMRQVAVQNRVQQADVRDLNHIPSSSVDLVVTSPPLPGPEFALREQWLKFWFLGISTQGFSERMWRGTTVESWLTYMNESLVELARVTKGGGRAGIALHDVTLLRVSEELDLRLVEMVQQNLGRFWNVECVLVHRERAPAVGVASRNRRPGAPPTDTKIVVLRRK